MQRVASIQRWEGIHKRIVAAIARLEKELKELKDKKSAVPVALTQRIERLKSKAEKVFFVFFHLQFSFIFTDSSFFPPFISRLFIFISAGGGASLSFDQDLGPEDGDPLEQAGVTQP